MRLLFVVLSYPLPANNGHKIRTWALLRALAAEGHDISLLAFAREGEVLGDEALVASVCRNVDIVPVAGRSVVHVPDIGGGLARLLSPRPFAVTRRASPALRSRTLGHALDLRLHALVLDMVKLLNLL